MAKTLPVILLKDFVLLPNQEVKVEPSHPLSYITLELAEIHYASEIIIVSPKDSLEEMPEVEDLPNIAVIAQIKKKMTLPNGHIRVTFVGLKRVKIGKYFNSSKNTEILECNYLNIHTPKINAPDEIAIKRELKKLIKKFIKLSPQLSNDIFKEIERDLPLNELTDYIAGFLPTTLENKTYYVEEINPLKRANHLLEDLTIELKVLKLDQKINQSLQKTLDKTQKDFVLRERIKEIEKELGEENKKQKEIEKYLEKLETLNITHTTKIKIQNEIKKYELMGEMTPEISSVRNYLELFFSLPWNEETIETEDLKMIETMLNKTHYGMKNVKNRILEYAAMKKRNPFLQAPIICLVGPPGVGKSTIAASIAAALHRKFYKISVGGLNDSAELIGHRRTYLGSAPGKIITSLQKCGSKNPLILIDEVDKMVKDYKGDPASVLLDILDSNLNQSFTDAYLEEPMDLSHVLFFLTANHVENIPSELKDRLEIIEVSSYSTLEKIELAKNYILPLIKLDYHLTKEEINISEDTLKYLILNYTKEAGVRDLKRKLEELYRKVILNSETKAKSLNITLETKDIKKYLEEPIDTFSMKPKIFSSGSVYGLAVTSIGGLVMPIESVMYPGSGKIKITGSIGKVMEESVEVVSSFIKSNAKKYQINEKFFTTKDIHIHVLEASISKDGPSGGVALATSLISLYTNKIISKNVAFTGEISLQGAILPVGKIKEKLIGAYNEKIKTVFIPEGNKPDLKGVPKEVKNDLEIVLVKEYQEIYDRLFI